MDTAIQALIEFVKNVAPAMWAVLIRQVYVEAVSNMAWGVAIGIIGWTSFKAGKHVENKEADGDDNYDYGVVKWMLWGLAGLLALGTFWLFTDAIMHLVNPEFYAIQWLIGQVK